MTTNIKNQFNFFTNIDVDIDLKKTGAQNWDAKENFKELPIGSLMDRHLVECPQTRVRTIEKIFRKFRLSFDALSLEELSTPMLRSWLENIRSNHNYSEKTLCRIKSQLNHFFRYLIEHEIIEISPLDKIRYSNRVPPRRKRIVLSKPEIISILQNMKSFDPIGLYPLTYALVHTGARRSEMTKLKWKEVDLEMGLIHLLHTKNGENRSIRISPKLHELLSKLPRQSEYVFINSNNTPWENNKLCRRVVQFKKSHPMEKNWGFHSLRHSFAYNFLKNGGEMYQLQAILGHKSITMTVDLYGQLKAQDIKDPSPYDF